MIVTTSAESLTGLVSEVDWLDALERHLGVMLHDVQALVGDDYSFFEFVTEMRKSGFDPAAAAEETACWLSNGLPG